MRQGRASRGRSPLVRCAAPLPLWSLAALLCAAAAHAQELPEPAPASGAEAAAAPERPAPAASAAPSQAPSAADLEPAAPAADLEPAAAADAAAAPAPSGPTREALLQAALAKAEREQPQLLLPWLAVGLSVATLVTGTVVGVIHVGSCEGSCSTAPLWPWLVIAGCTLTTASSAWLIVALHDASEARHRVERAREELERDRVDRAPRAAPSSAFTLRARF